MSYLSRANGYEPTGRLNSEPKLDDSGQRTQYATGGQRERAPGKGRYDLIPPEAVDALAKVLEAGAAKYGDRNWEKGLPLDTFLDSGLRHFFKLLAGKDDEDHAAMALTNLAMFITTRERGIDGLSVSDSLMREVEPDLAAQVRAAQMRGWQEGDKANVDELAERKRAVDSGWISPNRCQPENPYPHVAHGYDRASSGAVLMVPNGAHWCDGYVDVGHKVQQQPAQPASRPLSKSVAQQARDIETIKRVADGLTKPRPIKDAPQA